MIREHERKAKLDFGLSDTFSNVDKASYKIE
jgi:hypothetical protein